MKILKWIQFSILTLTFLLLANTLISQNIDRMKDRFYIGTINIFTNPSYNTQTQLSWYNELNLNAMHSYCFHSDYDSTWDGGFFADVNDYSGTVNNNLLKWSSNCGINHSLLLEREKIVRPAYGQRSTYLVKYTPDQLQTTKEICPGYGFLFRKKTPVYDGWYDTNFHENVTAINCIKDYDTAGFIVKELYENGEQVNNLSSDNRLWSDIKDDWYHYRWFVKPRMRIDSLYAKTHLDDTVVVIKVTNYSGDTIKRISIKCLHFLKWNSNIQDYEYNGRYLECYFNLLGGDTVQSVLASALTQGAPTDAKGMNSNLEGSKVDYQIYWTGQVSVWLDYVRVDDEWAHYLFTDSLDVNLLNRWHFHERLNAEINAFKNNDALGYFYFDEAQRNNIPCMAEVNRLVREYSNNTTELLPLYMPGGYCITGGCKNIASVDSEANYIYSTGVIRDIVMPDYFPYMFSTPLPANVTLPDASEYHGTRLYFKASSNDEYNNFMNTKDVYGVDKLFLYYYKKTAKFCKDHSLTYAADFQINSDENNIAQNITTWGAREPTSEEISLQSYLPLAYGAKQLIYFMYYSSTFEGFDYALYNDWGLLDTLSPYLTKRYKNYYNLDKWDAIVNNNVKLKKIGDFMYTPGEISKHFVWDNTKSVNFSGLPYRYVQNIESYQRYTGTNNFDTTNSETNKYWEIGFFNDPQHSDYKYMMVVNKRASPEINLTGDLRKIKFTFSGSEVQGFNNWELKEIATGEKTVFAFSNGNSVIFPNVFQPGEGKLLRLAPVMKVGGNLIADETLGGGANFTCDSTVYNDGHNILFYVGCTIKFNQKGKIVCNGGSFISGHYPDVPVNQRDIFQGNNSALWEGLSFENCSNVEIGNSDFSDIYYNSYLQNQNTAIDIQDCYNFVINGCNFTLNTESSAVDVNISSNAGTRWYNADIYYNNFTFTEHSTCPIYVNSLSSNVIPVNISNNNFVNTNEQPINMAIFVNGLTGGTIRNNIINNFNPAITVSSSTLDLFNNYIYSNVESGVGISAIAGSDLNMNPNAGYFTGGHNQITTANLNCNNINVNNSIFDLQNGSNVFNISSTQNSSYHLYGFFPVDSAIDNVLAENNCFQIDNVYPLYPSEQVTWGENGSPVNFDFDPYSCSNNNFQDYEVFTFSNAYNDTVYKIGTGNGGGASNEELKIKNEELEEQRLDEISEIQGNCKKLRDSVNILIRKRDYVNADSKCKILLLNYPDSVQTLTAINLLYLATISRDSLTSRVNMLKTFYESIILNNPNNTVLIDRAFYFIQKCKVALKQYQSAMQGFRLIMEQNPYSYEGLVASWDYAATHLLDSLNGHGGAFNDQYSMDNVQIKEQEQNNIIQNSENKFSIFSEIKLNMEIERAMTGLDSSKFSKKDKTKIKISVKKVIEDSKTKQINKVTELTNKSKTGDKKSTDELKTLKNLNDVIKLKKPKTKIELKKIISNDISKVFGKKVKNASETVKIIPKEFALYQNYPNPFNPITKINYDLPKDTKVTLVIYDILGREMKRLVNNEFKQAGKYSIEFNGQFLASEVYFYRIVADKFVQVKKMVLIK